MVTDVLDWKWSSYRAMIGKAKQPIWLETDWLLSHFHSKRRKAEQSYINFVRSGVGLESVWLQLKTAGFLAEQSFIDRILDEHDIKKGDEIKEFSRLERRAIAKPIEWYLANFEDKKEGMAKAFKSGNFTMKEISKRYEVHYSTVSRAVKYYEIHECKT